MTNNSMDGYGIVKTDKSMQNPSQVQSAWQKGANVVNNKGMDSYGIVKTDKSMQNPSQVQSAWQKGANAVDNKGMDGYGIVKGLGDDLDEFEQKIILEKFKAEWNFLQTF